MSAEIDLCGAPAGLMNAGVVLGQRCVQSVRRSASSTGVKLSLRFPWLGQRLDLSTTAHCGSLTRLAADASVSIPHRFEPGAGPPARLQKACRKFSEC